MKPDFSTIAADALLRAETLLFAWLPGGKVEGHEFKVGSFQGEPGKSLSVNLQTGVWKDFAADVGGADLINLFAAIHGITQGDAARAVADQCGSTPPEPPRRPKSDKWAPVVCPPDAAQWSPTHSTLGTPARIWDYRDASGALLGRVCRFILADGSKESRPCCYAEGADGLKGWRWQAWAKPYLPYRLPELLARPEAPVLIVEGEKAADAAQALFPHVVATCWPFGAGAPGQTDWSCLAGRTCILWPDNDAPGYKAARKLGKLLHDAGAAAVHYVHPPADLPPGWDLADADWTPDVAKANANRWLQQTPPDWVEPQPPPDEAPPEEPPHEDLVTIDDLPPGEDVKPENVHVHEKLAKNAYFRPLGRLGRSYYYFSAGAQDVIELAAEQHSKARLTEVAPLGFWWSAFKGESEKATWDNALNTLMRWSQKLGIFDPDRVRGLGAWWDDGRPVVHVGDRLIVDGKPIGLDEIKSRFIYCASKSIDFDTNNPLTDAESRKLLALGDRFYWEHEISGKLLNGFSVLAPCCGAWDWRPAIWVRGPRGCGKSYIASEYVEPLLGNFCFPLRGSAVSEAGIRQGLTTDRVTHAKPVLLDEAGDSRAGHRHIGGILELMRQASSNTNARIVKGSAGGTAQFFDVRSMFAYFSINVGTGGNAADESRITVLPLKDPSRIEHSREHFKQLHIDRQELLTPEYCSRLRARTVSLIPVIRENAREFTLAAAAVLGSQRAGDQVGILLAGAYSLYSRERITREGAEAWIAKHQTHVEAVYAESNEDNEGDGETCLARLLETKLEVYSDRTKRNHKMLAGELIPIAAGRTNNEYVTLREAREVLGQFGIKVDDLTFTISNRSIHISEALSSTIWGNFGWSRILRDVEGASTGAQFYWASGQKSRGVTFRVSRLMAPDKKAEPVQAPLIPATPEDPADDYYGDVEKVTGTDD